MWGESSKDCENNCQCSGLITDNFRINSGNNATKRKQEDSLTNNYKTKMNPHSIDFTKPPISPLSPIYTPSKRRILGEIQLQSPRNSQFQDKYSSMQENSQFLNKNLQFRSMNSKSPFQERNLFQEYPKKDQIMNSPFSKTSPFESKSSPHSKNSPFRTSPLQELNSIQDINSPLLNNTTPVLDTSLLPNLKSKTLFSSENSSFLSQKRSPTRSFRRISKVMEERSKFKMSNKENDSSVMNSLKIDDDARDFVFGDRFQANKVDDWSNTKLDFSNTLKTTDCVPDPQITEDLDDFGTLHDLEDEFTAENFDSCTKYEIISTDSPDIISRGRDSSRKVTSRNFMFGAPILENEASTSFNRAHVSATRMLTFHEDSFHLPHTSTQAAKKSLKFTITPPKLRHEKSDSSIGSLGSSSMGSLQSPKTLFSETTSMESGFISELEEFIEIDESNSPKIANFNQLLSGEIKNTIEKSFLKRPSLGRSLSFNPEGKKKRELEDERDCKRRKEEEKERPVLHRAYSENNASIMSAMTRSLTEPDLIGDFSKPYALPLVNSNSSLKSISADTLAALLRGEYSQLVADYTIIDCRYPYEYEGGHISPAHNWYTPAHIMSLLDTPPVAQTDDRRHVVVFHCEFSLERGPALCRLLRSADRQQHAARYPWLRFPELYVLHEGYRAFYRAHPQLCTDGYTAMRDPRHRLQLHKHTAHRKRTRLLL